MQSQIDYQIARARAAASRSKPGTAPRLAKRRRCSSALERLHVERGLKIENNVPASVMVACEAQDLNEILANLVDNACKFARTRVIVRTEKTARRAS